MKRAPLLALCLAGCLPVEIPQNPPKHALTLPQADGRGQVVHRDPHDYMVSRMMTSHGFEMRVTRLGRDFDYSEGVVAKKVAETFCAGFNRQMGPALARFSQPNAWVFGGDCA